MKLSRPFLILMLILCGMSFSAAGEDFDMSLMEKMGNLKGVDTSVLEHGSQTVPGDYPVELMINTQDSGQITLPFRLADKTVQPVFTATQLHAWGIVTDRSLPGQHPLNTFVDNAKIYYDSGGETLWLTVPQARFTPPSGDVAPEQSWVSGLNAARINYNMSLQRDTGSQSQNNSTITSTLNNGLNLGNWRIRNDGYFSYRSGESSHYQSSSSYVARDIAAIKSTFRGGDFFTDGKIFSPVSLRGMTLYSSEEMRPDSQRFYMPAISGTARTDATVVIRQNGFVIEQQRVTPGPFLIKDLHNASSSGDLDITVHESDGSIQHFTQAYNTISALLPPGVFNYTLSAGCYRNSSKDKTLLAPGIYQIGTFYGLNNTFTLLAGQQFAQQSEFHYQNTGTGIATNMPALGGMSLLLKRSQLRAETLSTAQQGKQLEARLVRSLNKTQSTLNLSWKHRYNMQYQEASDAINAAQGMPPAVGYHDQYNVQLDQNIAKITLMLRYVEDHTWQGKKQRSSRIGLSMSCWQSQVQIYYTHQHDLQGVVDNSLDFNIEIPLGRTQNHRIGFNSITDSHTGSQQMASVNGAFMDDNQLTYDINMSGQGSPQTGSMSGTYSGSGGLVSGGVSQGKGYQQTHLGLEGGIIVHHHGVTLSQPLGDTVVLVHTPHTRGLKIENSLNVYTDRQGNAVIPYAVPYRENDVELNPDSLDRQIDLPSAVKKVVPTQGAVVEVDFNALRQDRRFARIFDSHLHALPFGVNVQDASHIEVGTGGAAGVLLANFSRAHWPLAVSLNGRMLCHIQQPATVPDPSTLWKLSCL